ncbi:MAG: hypothetical protein RI591_03785 [Dehalococcoidia bacterium]|nr:hypothetical protein [Dehalococcoidia bacterium]
MPSQVSDINGDRIRSDLDLTAIKENIAFTIINLSPFNKNFTGMQEVMDILLGLQAHNIVGTKPPTDRIAHVAGQELPITSARPRYMSEVVNDGIGDLFSNVTCG